MPLRAAWRPFTAAAGTANGDTGVTRGTPADPCASPRLEAEAPFTARHGTVNGDGTVTNGAPGTVSPGLARPGTDGPAKTFTGETAAETYFAPGDESDPPRLAAGLPEAGFPGDANRAYAGANETSSHQLYPAICVPGNVIPDVVVEYQPCPVLTSSGAVTGPLAAGQVYGSSNPYQVLPLALNSAAM